MPPERGWRRAGHEMLYAGEGWPTPLRQGYIVARKAVGSKRHLQRSDPDRT
jgi:hypothetical protein